MTNDDAPLPMPMGWQVEAACRGVDPDLFYPTQGESTAEAKAVCRECPVTAECLAYALETRQQFGIWGGKSERERRPLRVEHHRYGVCVTCGDTFVRRSQNHRACSPECSKAANNARQREWMATHRHEPRPAQGQP